MTTLDLKTQIVERAEAYLRAHTGTPVPVSTLSRVMGLSERGLRNAFYIVRGMSPKRCMLAERLLGVRIALSDPSTKATTVTTVAADFGFYELGRFAGHYKKMFGELPSATLRGTSVIGRRTAKAEGGADGCTSKANESDGQCYAPALDAGAGRSAVGCLAADG